MGAEVGVSGNVPGQPRYARFSRRLKAMLIDWIIVLATIFGAIFLAASFRDDSLSRGLGILVVIVLLLYEPILVSFTGGTIGHSRTNLRVVDDRTGGNVGFLKASARSIIKSLLGWYSFLTMMATRRNQAVHDLLTKSTVQIRDPAEASQYQYVTERVESLDGSMPSRLRRVAAIVVYLLLVFVACTVANSALFLMGFISRGCAYAHRCGTAEGIAMFLIGATWFAMSALCIGLGWRGKLFGARRKV